MEKFCQSCAMPLTLENLGTEKNGSPSQKYCDKCYQKGNFIDPNLTFTEMKAKGLEGIANDSGSVISKFFKKLFYPALLKKMSRWRN